MFTGTAARMRLIVARAAFSFCKRWIFRCRGARLKMRHQVADGSLRHQPWLIRNQASSSSSKSPRFTRDMMYQAALYADL